MSKGRNLTMSRSERYLGSYSYCHGHETVGADEQDLREDDVWSAVSDETAIRRGGESDERYGAWKPRVWATSNRRVSGLSSLAFEDDSPPPPPPSSSIRILHQVGGNDGSEGVRHVAASAPVNVPDWRKIYRVNSVECMNESEEEEDGESWNMMPPHEYLARSQARRSRKTGSGGGSGGSSVFEGVGRTLKGRDLRRVRDAVWSQTGFYG